MIKIPIIDDCPYTRAGTGVIHMPHNILATIAGAVYDSDEWIILLLGARSKDGLTIDVKELKIPEQRRSHSNCELWEPEDVGPEVVGVMHSHHSMGVFFSGIDKTTLNPRFPMSIVVAQPRDINDVETRLLGFSYKAEGRAQLPCGSIGLIGYGVMPAPVLDQWPVILQQGYSEPANTDLYGCSKRQVTLEGLTQLCTTECGIQRTEPARAVFGRDGKAFLEEVTKKTKGGYYQNGLVQVTDHRREMGFRHDNLWERDFYQQYGEGWGGWY